MAWYLLCSPGWSQSLRKYCFCWVLELQACITRPSQKSGFCFCFLADLCWVGEAISLPTSKVQVQLLKCSGCHQTLLLTPVIVLLVGTSPAPSGVLKDQVGSLDSFRLSISSLAPVPAGCLMDCSGIGLFLPLFLHPSAELYLPFEFYHFIRSFIQVNVLLSL